MRAEDRHRRRRAQERRRFWSGLAHELRDGARTPRFWLSLARNGIPLFGVFVLHWDALLMAVYFLLQSWLMGSLYCAIDLTFNPEKGTPPRDLLDAMGPLTKRFVAAMFVFALFVGVFGAFMLYGFFSARELARFYDGGWAQSSFLSGLLALVVGCVAEAVRFLRSIGRRTPAAIVSDNARFAATIQTVAVMCVIATFLGAAGRYLMGATAAFAIAAVLVVMLFDVAPRSAAVMLGAPTPGADTA